MYVWDWQPSTHNGLVVIQGLSSPEKQSEWTKNGWPILLKWLDNIPSTLPETNIAPRNGGFQ